MIIPLIESFEIVLQPFQLKQHKQWYNHERLRKNEFCRNLYVAVVTVGNECKYNKRPQIPNVVKFKFGCEDILYFDSSYVTIYSILLIASLVRNSLLIFPCLKSKTTINLIITNEAVSDLLYSIVHFPREIAVQIKGSTAFLVHGWIGHVLCKICAFTVDAAIAVSTPSLILVAADRLVAVVFPTEYNQITVKKRRLLILSTWIVATAIHSPYFYTFRLDAINGETFCFTNWEPAFNHDTTLRYCLLY